MKRNWIALIVAAGAFLAWMSYLGAKAWQYRHPPVIVSRAQLLGAEWDATVDVAADPADPKKPALNVTVREVLHSKTRTQRPNLARRSRCRIWQRALVTMALGNMCCR